MTDMREQIAAIIVRHWCSVTGNIDQYNMADDIMAALPSMIAPLVWDYRGNVSCTAHTPFGKYLVETCHEDGFGMWTPRDETEDDPPFGYHDDIHEAQAAANTHHRASIMAAFTGETP
jgi:hypothetical protein